MNKLEQFEDHTLELVRNSYLDSCHSLLYRKIDLLKMFWAEVKDWIADVEN